jgi:anti-sigma factor RsiW
MSEIPARCAPFEADLSAFADEQLDAHRASEVRAQLASCGDGTRRLQRLSEVDAALRRVAATPIPAAQRARMRAAIASARPAHRAPPRRRRWLVPAALATAAAAAGLLWVSRSPAPVVPADAVVAMAEPAAQKLRADAEVVARELAAGIEAPVGASEAPSTPAPTAATAPPDLEIAASDEDLALATALRAFPALDSPRDLEVVEQLDLLETLGALEDADTGAAR